MSTSLPRSRKGLPLLFFLGAHVRILFKLKFLGPLFQPLKNFVKFPLLFVISGQVLGVQLYTQCLPLLVRFL